MRERTERVGTRIGGAREGQTIGPKLYRIQVKAQIKVKSQKGQGDQLPFLFAEMKKDQTGKRDETRRDWPAPTMLSVIVDYMISV